MPKPHLTLPSALGLLSAALWTCQAAAVTLPPTSPLVFSQVWGYVDLNAEVYLADTEETLHSSRNIDYAAFTSQVRSGTALLGGSSLGRDFTQSGIASPSVYMGGSSQSDFGINKVRAKMLGADVPGSTQSYGSMPASQAYRTRHIDNYFATQWDWNTVQWVYDYALSRNIAVPAGTLWRHEPNPNTGIDDLVWDTPGEIYNDGYNFFYIAPVPTTMPEVVINRSQTRSVQAYSRWEDIFYFGPTAANPANTGGTATIRLTIDGTAQGQSGAFQFLARDWANKDSFDTSTYLAYTYSQATAAGTNLDQTLDINIDFVYGQPNYIKAEAWAWLWGEGEVDASNTVRITGIDLGAGTAVYSYGHYLAGTAPGYDITGGGINGNASGGAGGFFGGGGGVAPDRKSVV